MAYTAFHVLRHIFGVEEVTRDVIHGTLVVYLLLGLMWGFIFALLEGLRPGAFNMPPGMIGESQLFFPA